jgi:hypothetical protein
VNVSDAVCPAEFTITIGIYVPATADFVAMNVSVPDGLVSVDAYIPETPPGNPLKFTSAVSLVELMVICARTGVPPGATTTVEGFNETVIGTMGTEPTPPPPHPHTAPATTVIAPIFVSVGSTRMGLSRQNRNDYRTREE